MKQRSMSSAIIKALSVLVPITGLALQFIEGWISNKQIEELVDERIEEKLAEKSEEEEEA